MPLKLFVNYEERTSLLTFTTDQTISQVKQAICEAMNIDTRDEYDRTLQLIYARAELEDSWIIGDVNIPSGATLRVVFQLLIRPAVYIYQRFCKEKVAVMTQVNFAECTVSKLRGIVSILCGVPVSVFRLLRKDGVVLLDVHMLAEYDLKQEDNIIMECWKGWNDFLTAAKHGFTKPLLQEIDEKTVVGRFRAKVAFYMAAHFGHVDLAHTLLKMGYRPDEAIGEHPYRQWIQEEDIHPNCFKTPIHIACEKGQLGVVRAFVHSDIAVLMSKDAEDLKPLNIALRRGQRKCAGFLITKQWSKVPYQDHLLPLGVFTQMKRWAARARASVFIKQGIHKSSLKKRPFNHTDALLGNGVCLDGYALAESEPLLVTNNPKYEELRRQERRDRERQLRDEAAAPSLSKDETPEWYFEKQNIRTALENIDLNRPKILEQVVTNHRLELLTRGRRKVEIPESTGLWRTLIKKSDMVDVVEEINQQEAVEAEDDVADLPPGVGPKQTLMRFNSLSEENLAPMLPSHHLTREKRKVSLSFNSLLADRSTLSDTDSEATAPASSQKDSRQKSRGKVQLPAVAPASKEIPHRAKRSREKSLGDLISEREKTLTCPIQLPLNSFESRTKPYVPSRCDAENPKAIMELYRRKYCKMDARETAIRCLHFANKFEKWPWLRQVQLATEMTKLGVDKALSQLPYALIEKPVDRSSDS